MSKVLKLWSHLPVIFKQFVINSTIIYKVIFRPRNNPTACCLFSIAIEIPSTKSISKYELLFLNPYCWSPHVFFSDKVVESSVECFSSIYEKEMGLIWEYVSICGLIYLNLFFAVSALSFSTSFYSLSFVLFLIKLDGITLATILWISVALLVPTLFVLFH